MNSSPAWSTEQVPGQDPKIQRNPASNKYEKERERDRDRERKTKNLMSGCKK